MSGGLIWLGIGLALAPVEAIRRRVDAIAAEDLTQRVPVTGGDDEIARMARTVNEMLDAVGVGLSLPTGVRLQRQPRAYEVPSRRCSPRRSGRPVIPTNTNWAEVAEVVMREGRRLDGIIGDLFWLARHDENHIDVESVRGRLRRPAL